ncbi:MAG: hypothetical protein ABIU05_17335, partial [Nitrospirales bacterium]
SKEPAERDAWCESLGATLRDYSGHLFPASQRLFLITAVRVLRRGTSVEGNVDGGLVRADGCERFELLAAFSTSSFPANLSGCTSENLSSLNSRT